MRAKPLLGGKPEFLGECRLGLHYVNVLSSILIDNSARTMWLDLSTKNFNKGKKEGALDFPIKRTDDGTRDDFSIFLSKDVREIFKTLSLMNPNLNLTNMIDIILEPSAITEDSAKEFIKNMIKKAKNINFDDLKLIKSTLSIAKKKDLDTLVHDEAITLVLGELPPDKEIENRVATEEVKFTNPKITEEEFVKAFSGLVLDPNKMRETFIGMGFGQILNGELPEFGGVILVDSGGTGKSLMKKKLATFWKKKIGGRVKEKDRGQITSYINAAPQLIRVWYRGGSMPGVESEVEEDLVAVAMEKKRPSLLIIDEAEDFLIEDRGLSYRRPIDGSTQALKRFIQDYEKGGVTGYVVTLLIANIPKEEIHSPIMQGGERLKVIYYGPPTSEKEWIKIIYIAIEKLVFSKETDFNKLANLLLLYNAEVFENEKITPRTFMDFCSTYYSNFTQDEINVDSLEAMHRSLKVNRKKKDEIELSIFIKNMISRLFREDLREKYSKKLVVFKVSDEKTDAGAVITQGQINELKNAFIDIMRDSSENDITGVINVRRMLNAFCESKTRNLQFIKGNIHILYGNTPEVQRESLIKNEINKCDRILSILERWSSNIDVVASQGEIRNVSETIRNLVQTNKDLF